MENFTLITQLHALEDMKTYK